MSVGVDNDKYIDLIIDKKYFVVVNNGSLSRMWSQEKSINSEFIEVLTFIVKKLDTY